MSHAYYNENDPVAAAWLRELIKEGCIAPGEVDERSITEVTLSDLAGFVQCHFFAGIGGWSYALRLAGWDDHRPAWTGSCPCQPFSLAGGRQGTADHRDLWPPFFALIRQRRPSEVFGEQVESAIRWGWLDRLCDDLEGEGYTVWPTVLPAFGVGAHHRRDRAYWGASTHTSRERLQGGRAENPSRPWSQERLERLVQAELRLAVPASSRGGLSDGLPYRVAGLRGLGNAIVPQLAAEFIQAYEEVRGTA